MSAHQQKCVAALFIRCPVPGRVKTRLARDLGDDDACALYSCMVTDIIQAVTTAALPLVLFYEGGDTVPPAWSAAALESVRQSGDSLGDRMTAAFKYLFAAGWQSVILTGSDIPGMDASLLQAAAQQVASHDIVLAPAFDGGYCLVASHQTGFNAGFFRGVPWSSEHVLSTTLEKCRTSGFSWLLLERRRDIDTLEDIRAYCRNPCVTAAATNSWLTSRGYMLDLSGGDGAEKGQLP